MSAKFEIVKNYFDKKLWTKSQVHAAVGRWITADEYDQIVGEPYGV